MLGPKRKNKKKRPSNKKKSNPITNPIGERQSLAPTVPLSLDEIERRCNKNAMTKKKPSLMKCADGFIIVALFFLHSFLIGHGPGAVFISGVGVNDGLLRKRNLGLICAETNKQTNKIIEEPSHLIAPLASNSDFQLIGSFFLFWIRLPFFSKRRGKKNKQKKNRRNPFPIDRLGQSRIDRRWPEQPIGAQIKRTTRRRSDRGERPTVRFDGGASFFFFLSFFFLSCACFCLIDRAVAVGLVADHVTRK